MRLFGIDISIKQTAEVKPLKKGSRAIFNVYRAPLQSLIFSDSEILYAQKLISNRLSNVQFSAKVDFIACNDIFAFLLRNRLQIIRRLFGEGIVIIDARNLCFGELKGRAVSTDYNGRISVPLMEDEIAIASETFESTGRSDLSFLADKVKFLDAINSSDFNLIQNYGAMGIVSPETDNSVAGAELTPEEVEELQKDYNDHYGLQLGKWTLMFAPRPVRYSKIDLPIAQLQLSDKRLYALKTIFAALEVPKEVTVYFDNSTFANRNEAEVDFYTNTVTKWAKVLERLAQKIYAKRQEWDSYLLPNEFWFDFIGVLALSDKQLTEKKAAREELQFWVELLEKRPQDAEMINKRITDLIERI